MVINGWEYYAEYLEALADVVKYGYMTVIYGGADMGIALNEIDECGRLLQDIACSYFKRMGS